MAVQVRAARASAVGVCARSMFGRWGGAGKRMPRRRGVRGVVGICIGRTQRERACWGWVPHVVWGERGTLWWGVSQGTRKWVVLVGDKTDANTGRLGVH